MPKHEFVCRDAHGNPHTYDCDPHGGSEGHPLALQLLALIVEPLATGAGPVLVQGLGKIQGKGRAAMLALITDPEILKSLDFAGLSRGARTAVLGMQQPLVCGILKYTNRDGKPLVDSSAASGAFDTAYARNYSELAMALWEVIKFNGFFPALSTIADGARKALAQQLAPPKSED